MNKHNPNAKDRSDWRWARKQRVNKLCSKWDYAVVRTDKPSAPYQPDDKHPQWNDARIITVGEGVRHNAQGRKGLLERKHDGDYEVRPYSRE